MNIHEDSSELSFVNQNLHNLPLLRGRSKQKTLVDMTTLDELYLNNPQLYNMVDFMKIDTEGHEMNVLIGASTFLRKVKPKYIQIEMNWHQLYNNNSLYSFSQILNNYDCFKVLPAGSSIRLIDPNLPINNIYQLSNFLFIYKS